MPVTRSRKGKATRKAGKPVTKPLSIPELKHAFDALDQGTRAILSEGSKEQQTTKFQRLWRSIFHRPVGKEAAEAYLAMKRSPPVGFAGPYRRKGKGQTRRMRGGANGGAYALAGAPLDYMTRPGVDGVHGSFPSYVSGGLGFYDKINQDALSADCGKVDITPQVPASIGSNLVGGGGLSDVGTLVTNRPVPASSPPSVFQEVQRYFAGQDKAGSSPDPSQFRLMA